MSYVMNLRKKIGHAPILMPCSVVVLVNENNQVLLQKRHDNNIWGLNGGSIEIDESCEDAAKRELYEETGLIADELLFFKVYSGEKYHFTYPNGDEVNTIEIVYVCKKYHGNIVPQKGEVDELRFFSHENIPHNLMNHNNIILEDYFKKED